MDFYAKLKRAIAAIAVSLLPMTAGAADLVIAGAAAAEDAPLFAAVEKGFFADAGLDIEVRMFTSGVEMINALNAGEVHATVMGSFPLLASVSKGLPLKLIAHNWGSALQESQSDVLSVVGLAASGIVADDAASLKGKRVGLPVGSGAEPYLIGLLNNVGLSKDDVEMVNIGPANLATALQNGDVDAISVWEAWPSNALTQVEGTVRVKSGDCDGCYFAGTILSTESLIASRGADLQKMLTAYAASQQWVRQNREEAATVSGRWISGTEYDTLVEAISVLPFDMRISQNTVNGYSNVILPLMVATGRIAEVYDPAVAIDSSLINAVQDASPDLFSDLEPLPSGARY